MVKKHILSFLNKKIYINVKKNLIASTKNINLYNKLEQKQIL